MSLVRFRVLRNLNRSALAGFWKDLPRATAVNGNSSAVNFPAAIRTLKTLNNGHRLLTKEPLSAFTPSQRQYSCENLGKTMEENCVVPDVIAKAPAQTAAQVVDILNQHQSWVRVVIVGTLENGRQLLFRFPQEFAVDFATVDADQLDMSLASLFCHCRHSF